MKIIEQKHLGVSHNKAESIKADDTRKNNTSIEAKIKMVIMFRVTSFIVFALGIAAMLIPGLPSQAHVVGNVLVLIGALGIIVTKTYIRKIKKQ